MMDGKRMRQLQEALCRAFGSVDELSQMVQFGLNENLAAIAGGNNLRALAFDLIRWADSRSRVDELVTAALEANPTSSDLLAYVAATRPAPPSDQPVQGAGAGRAALALTLARLYDNKGAVGRISDEAGIARERVDFDGPILNVWHSVLAEADKSGLRRTIVDIAGRDYPAQRADLVRMRG
jgi:hypothetical protein